MLDELGLRALWAQKGEEIFGVTMSMEVKYRKPVPYQEELVGRGILIKDTPKFAVIKSEIYSPDGILLVHGNVTYIKLSVEKIAKNVAAHEEMCYLIEDDVRELPF